MTRTTRGGNWRWVAAALGAMAVAIAVGPAGCYKDVIDEEAITASASAVPICTACGFVKGSPECCKVEGKALCPKCGLVKGSPGCCLVEKGSEETVYICTACGFVKGSPECCKVEGKALCPKCGLVKGSPGCCKIK